MLEETTCKPDRVVRFCPYERYSNASRLARTIFLNRTNRVEMSSNIRNRAAIKMPNYIPLNLSTSEVTRSHFTVLCV
jgi:hypothetical protein